MTDRVWRWGVPPVVYTAVFFALSPHLPSRFFTHLYADNHDGFQTYWDVWWVQKAILELHQSIYFTTLLHYPHGTTLIAQTMHPFNGLVSLFLPFLTAAQAYNLMVVVGFVAGGWTAFLLCRDLTGSNWPSLAGGAVFTFSAYHFAHAEGHMQLVSLEWLPLFILLWRRFVRSADRPGGVRRGVTAAVVLYLLVLCDFYYFMFAVWTAALDYAWVARERRDALFLLRQHHRRATIAFVVPTLLTSGVLVSSLYLQHFADRFRGSHDPYEFAMDLLAPFVPGGHWRFGDWTQPIWEAWPGNTAENSVHLGWGVIFLFAYVWRHRAAARIADVRFWYLLAAVFGVLSLGPRLIVAGHDLVPFPPYLVASTLFPPLRLAGVPVRLMIMVQLVAAIVTAGGLRLILERTGRRGVIWVTAILALTTIEYLPTPIPTTRLEPPRFAQFLKAHPDPGAVYDDVTPPPLALFGQTIHGRPLAYGYISRTPTSVVLKNNRLREVADAGDYEQLCRGYGFRFIVGGAAEPLPRQERLELVYSDPERKVFRICPPG